MILKWKKEIISRKLLITYLRNPDLFCHSSEKRGLRSTFCPRKMLQNLLCLCAKKTCNLNGFSILTPTDFRGKFKIDQASPDRYVLLIMVFGGWNQKLSKMNDGNTLKKCRLAFWSEWWQHFEKVLAFWSDKSKRAADKNREKCDDDAVQNIFLPSWYYCMLLQAKKSTRAAHF